MKTLIAIALCSTLFGAGIACAQGSYTASTTKATISGTSTLHDWESAITKVDWKSELAPKPDSILSIRNVEAVILVEGIKSKEGKTMDNKTYEAFDSKKNPNITFRCKKVIITPGAGKKSFKISAPGNLTMAGVTRKVTLAGEGVVEEDGTITFGISQSIKMTDFNMIPPKAVLGTIKVGNEVTVLFEFLLKKN